MTDAIKLTADLIQRRDDMRQILGDRYRAEVTETMSILRAVSKEWKLPITETALALAKGISNAGHNPSIVFAALVEELELQRPNPS